MVNDIVPNGLSEKPADQSVVNDEVEHAPSPIPAGAENQPSSEGNRSRGVAGSRVLVWLACATTYFIGVYQESPEISSRVR